MSQTTIIVVETTNISNNYSVDEIKSIITRKFQSEEGKTIVDSIDRSEKIMSISISDNISKVMDKTQVRKNNPISYTHQIDTMIIEDVSTIGEEN